MACFQYRVVVIQSSTPAAPAKKIDVFLNAIFVNPDELFRRNKNRLGTCERKLEWLGSRCSKMLISSPSSAVCVIYLVVIDYEGHQLAKDPTANIIRNQSIIEIVMGVYGKERHVPLRNRCCQSRRMPQEWLASSQHKIFRRHNR